MGVYIYTRRIDVKQAGPVPIVRYGYAYKPFRGWDVPRRIKMAEARYEAAGERAVEATRGITRAIIGEWPVNGGEPVAVCEIPDDKSSIVDDLPRKVVGYLTRQGNRFILTDVNPEIARA